MIVAEQRSPQNQLKTRQSPAIGEISPGMIANLRSNGNTSPPPRPPPAPDPHVRTNGGADLDLPCPPRTSGRAAAAGLEGVRAPRLPAEAPRPPPAAPRARRRRPIPPPASALSEFRRGDSWKRRAMHRPALEIGTETNTVRRGGCQRSPAGRAPDPCRVGTCTASVQGQSPPGRPVHNPGNLRESEVEGPRSAAEPE